MSPMFIKIKGFVPFIYSHQCASTTTDPTTMSCIVFLCPLPCTVNKEIQPKVAFTKNRINANGKVIFFVVSIFLRTLNPNNLWPKVAPLKLVNNGSYSIKINTMVVMRNPSGIVSNAENSVENIIIMMIKIRLSTKSAFIRTATPAYSVSFKSEVKLLSNV